MNVGEVPEEYNLYLANGMVTYAQPAKYFKDEFNVTRVFAGITKSGGNLTTNDLIAQLPLGFRPAYHIETPAVFLTPGDTYAPQVGLVKIDNDGQIKIGAGSPLTTVFFDLSFIAAF